MRDDLNATAQSQFSDHDEYDSSADSFETPVASVERPQSVMRQPAILADHSIGTKYGLPAARRRRHVSLLFASRDDLVWLLLLGWDRARHCRSIVVREASGLRPVAVAAADFVCLQVLAN